MGWQSRRLFGTPWAVAHHAPLSMGFSRQEYWSGVPCSSPGDLPDPGIKPMTLASPTLAGEFLRLVPPLLDHTYIITLINNYLKWIKCTNQKTQTGCVDENKYMNALPLTTSLCWNPQIAGHFIMLG